MAIEQRKNERFVDVGRVDAPELCIFPGILEDISICGSKIRFPANFDVELDMDINLAISPNASNFSKVLHLIAHPKWIKNHENETLIGFKFLRSPGTHLLNSYIEKLTLANAEFNEEDQFLCSVI